VDDGAAVITVGDFAVNHLAVDHRLGGAGRAGGRVGGRAGGGCR